MKIANYCSSGHTLRRVVPMAAIGLTFMAFAFGVESACGAAEISLYAAMGDSALVLVDTSSASLQTVLQLDHSFRCLTYDPHTETIFGISHQYGPRLVTIDPVTGATTFIDTLWREGGEVYTSEAIAYNPEDSLLYCSASVNGSDASSEILALLDPATAEVSPLGTFSGTLANDGDAMVFIDDTLYVVDDPHSGPSYFYRVDHADTPGEATLIGILNSPRFNNVNDMAFHPESRMLYGFDPSARVLITIDWHAGVGTLVGATHTPQEYHGKTMWAITVAPAGIATSVTEAADNAPSPRTRLANAPNPFNPVTEIRYEVPTARESRKNS